MISIFSFTCLEHFVPQNIKKHQGEGYDGPLCFVKRKQHWLLIAKKNLNPSCTSEFFYFFAPEIRTRKSPHYFLNIPKCIYFNFANVHGYMVEQSNPGWMKKLGAFTTWNVYKINLRTPLSSLLYQVYISLNRA